MGSVSVIAIGVVAAAAWAEGPIPLKAPTGYRDYCDGLPKSKRSLCPPGRAPQGLWRKLALPTVSAGGTCPVSAMRAIPGIQAPALGTGPVYFPAGAYNPADRTTMRIVYPASSGPARGSGWGIAKAQLLVKKTFRQPLVVRGRRIDGASELVAPSQRGIALGAWKAYGLLVWATTPGCYALQVDGQTFTRVIVFRVEFAASP